MNGSSEDLHRYHDGEMEPVEAEQFRLRLAASAELRRELAELERVGAALRTWVDTVEPRGRDLVGPTLARVRDAEQKRAGQATFVYALAAVLVLGVPWGRDAAQRPQFAEPKPQGAAIERIEAGGKAQVFVLGAASTPVVWLADDAGEETAEERGRGPG